MRNKEKGAFSLAELMVVIAIISILAAVAVPVYQSYVLRVRLSQSANFAMMIVNAIKTEYSKNGELPSSVMGLTLQTSTGSATKETVSNNPNVASAMYRAISTYSTYPRHAIVHIDLNTDIGSLINGYVDGGKNSRITAAFVEDSNGVIHVYCGNWNPAVSTYLDPEMLPSGCQDIDIFHANINP